MNNVASHGLVLTEAKIIEPHVSSSQESSGTRSEVKSQCLNKHLEVELLVDNDYSLESHDPSKDLKIIRTHNNSVFMPCNLSLEVENHQILVYLMNPPIK